MKGKIQLATIKAVALADVLSKPTQEPSQRTLQTKKVVEDSKAILDAIMAQGAASITVPEEEGNASHYLGLLRAAFHRQGRKDVLLQKKRGTNTIVAWFARDDDKGLIETRQKRGQQLGAVVRQRAQAHAKVLAQANKVVETAHTLVGPPTP